jgi:integrase
MLTDRQIQAAIKGCTDETVLNDGAAGRGTGSLRLVIRKRPGGTTATWFASWKLDGRRAKKSLGRYPDVKLVDARERMATEIRPALGAGRNPRVVVAVEGRPTVARLFRGYVDAMKAKGRATWPQVERALLTGKHNAAEALGSGREAGAIGPEDVAALLARVYARGSRVGADRLRAYVSAAFNWGMKSTHDYTVEARRDWGIRHNPAAGVQRDTRANRTRERNLSGDEIAALWFGMAGEGYAPETTGAVRLMLCCGQRARETLRVAGCEIDLQAGVWNMPAIKTKGRKRAHSIPLPALAVDILRRRIEECGDGLLFPSREGSQGEHITDGGVSRALRRYIKASGAAPFQLRDLRRTWKSRTGDIGIDRFTRDLIQQHAQGDTGSKHYDRAGYAPQMRQAMTAWNDWLSKELERFGKSIGVQDEAA